MMNIARLLRSPGASVGRASIASDLMVAALTFAVLTISFPFLVAITPAGAMALTSVAPIVGIFAFVLNSLLFVEDAGSLTSRYPRYMLTLPVRTGSLVFWPMLFVSIGSGLLWLAVALLGLSACRISNAALDSGHGAGGLDGMGSGTGLDAHPRLLGSRFHDDHRGDHSGRPEGALPVWLMVASGSAGLAASLLITYIAAAYLVAWAAVASDPAAGRPVLAGSGRRRRQSWRSSLGPLPVSPQDGRFVLRSAAPAFVRVGAATQG